MRERIKKIRKLRDELEAGGMKIEELMKFEAMLHTYERKMNKTGKADLSDSEYNDFYRIFSIEIDKMKGEK